MSCCEFVLVVQLLHVRKLPAAWFLHACMYPSLPVVLSSNLPIAAIVCTMCQSQLPQQIEVCACHWGCRDI